MAASHTRHPRRESNPDPATAIERKSHHTRPAADRPRLSDSSGRRGGSDRSRTGINRRMNLPAFSVKRPIFTTMVTLIVLLLGAVSFSRLQIDLLPSIEMSTLSIRTSYDGASPEVMEQHVTQILEEIAATVPNVEEITSTSQEGYSQVRVTFGWGTNLDAAAIDLQATIEQKMRDLPEDIDRPRIGKFDINAFPVVLLGIASDLDPVQLNQLIEDEVR